MTGKPPRNPSDTESGTTGPGSPADPSASGVPQHLLRAIEILADSVLLCDAEGTILYANRAMRDRCGYAEAPLTGQPVTALWIQPNAITQAIMAELATRHIWRGRVQHRTRDGRLFRLAVTISPVVDENDSLTHLILAGRPDETADAQADVSGSIDKTYKNILDLMGDGYVETDLKGRTTFFNQTAARIYRRTPEEMIGLSYKEYMTPPEAKRIRTIYNEIYRTGRSDQIIDFQIHFNDGTIAHCETNTTLLRDHQGTPVGFGGVIRDVTEKRMLTAKLTESEESYRRVMELAPDAITITRVSDGRYYEVNETFCQQTGYARHEVIGRTVKDLDMYADPADRGRLLRTLRRDGIVSGMRVTFRHRDGSLLHDIVSARKIQFKGEACVLFVATLINSLVEAQNAVKESEKRYRMILNAAPDAICLTRLKDGRYIEASPTFFNRSGYTPEETIGRTATDIGIYANPGDRDRFIAALQENGQVDGMEIMARYKDGTLSAQLWSGRVIEYNGEQCLLVIAKSIEELKETQKKLREREESYRTILNTSPYSITISRRTDGTFLLVNDAFCRRTGYSREETLGRTAQDLGIYTSPDDRARLIEKLERDGHIFGMELNYQAKSGEFLESLASVSPILHRGETCILTMSVDIREQKRAQRELARYRQHLEEMVQERTRELKEAQNELIKKEKLAVLGQLTATVSHELRNPLGVIRSSNYFLSRKIETRDDLIEKHIRRIEEQVGLCDVIVADLLEFTRGSRALPAKQAIAPWIRQVVSQMTESEGFDIHLDLDEKLPPVPHDQEKMLRVVINLLDNAIQAVRARQEAPREPDDPFVPRIALRVARQADNVLLQVSDNGCGMDEATRRRAFEPLFTTRARGTGIGLANVKKIVTEHNGSIALQSEPNQGTTMSILLPSETGPPETDTPA